MSHADDVVLLVAELLPILAALADLLPEQPTDAGRGSMQHHKITGSPAPWHPEAAIVLMDVHEGVRRLEASMRREVVGDVGRRRGGSDGNTAQALDAICRLAYGLPDDRAGVAARLLERWVRQARTVRDIGLDEPWEPIRVPHGQMPPRCPYCSTPSLRVQRTGGRVTCVYLPCTDRAGARPAGRLEHSMVTRDAMIIWNDGHVSYYEGVVS